MGIVRWTREEDALITRLYPVESHKQIQERFLSHRSANAIRMRASYLDVKKLGATALVPKEKRIVYGYGGVPYEYGTTASTKPGMERVPEAKIGLPWVKYPHSVAGCDEVIAACSVVLAKVGPKMGAEAYAFFATSKAYAEAEKHNLSAQAA
jgi:hypothetical protein